MSRVIGSLVGVPLLFLLPASHVAAENIDPLNDGSQHAYGENVGWLNAEPLGNAGPGVQVGDHELSGWMWGENVGWISLSCDDTLSCGAADYRVNNNGSGVLSGFAWGENIGWLSFSCANTGTCASGSYDVTIDPSTGTFAGRAWGENVGWVTFASNGGPAPFALKSGWVCSPAPPAPGASPRVVANRTPQGFVLAWVPLAGATGYDIVSGDLNALQAANGNFAVATAACLDDDRTTTSMIDNSNPSAGNGRWYIVRGQNCGGSGSYDDGPAQAGSRDPGIGASGHDCD